MESFPVSVAREAQRFSIPLINPRFSSDGLKQILKDILGERELRSPDLKTGLAIIAKRVDTGSVWVLTNNPKSKYWEDRPADPEKGEPKTIGNKYYKLREVVRASTAAPFFFAPEEFEILSGKLKGLFVDGGVSPYNNPSMQLLMLAGIDHYGFHWPVSKDTLLLISIGAGWARPTIARHGLFWAPRLAIEALHGVIWDSHIAAMTLLQWMSSPRLRWELDSEKEGLEGEALTKTTGGGDLLSFQRYDVDFSPDWLKRQIGEDISQSELKRLNDFLNPGIMKEAYALASKVAARQVHGDDFPAGFDVALERDDL